MCLFFTDRPRLVVTQTMELQESVLKLAATQLITVPQSTSLCNNHVFDTSGSRSEFLQRDGLSCAENCQLPLTPPLNRSSNSRMSYLAFIYRTISVPLSYF